MTKRVANRKRKATYNCPFLRGNGQNYGVIRCEGKNQMVFESSEAAHEYAEIFCASKNGGWQNCEIAAKLIRQYERVDAINKDLIGLKLHKKITTKQRKEENYEEH